MDISNSIISALENIYISPLEQCNLNCKSCYTQKTKNILNNQQILGFVDRYSSIINLKSILFCGGEVFLLADFPKLVNQLIRQNTFITIITNGTIDRLSEIENPTNCQLLVSLDGPKNIHDQNRGQGNFQKNKEFIRHALKLGFPAEIMFLINSASYPFKDSFDLFNLKKTYLTDRLHSLTKEQVLDIKKNYPTYPAKNFGCFQLALQSDGLIYGCCESPKPLAKLTDPPKTIVDNFANSLATCHKCKLFHNSEIDFSARNHVSKAQRVSTAKINFTNIIQCQGCSDPSFLCGYKSEISCKNCSQVVKTFNT